MPAETHRHAETLTSADILDVLEAVTVPDLINRVEALLDVPSRMA